MLEHIRKSKYTKAISLLIAMQLFFGFFQPVEVFALTSGPAQPEFQGFSPIGNSNMVDLASGDFSYNIDLITLPGPNGGYPLKLNYNAGVTMEQEASWVGLGWNLNTGAIIRSVKGIPDDFDGENYTKTYYAKPNTSISGTYDGKDSEIFGYSLGKLDKFVDSEKAKNILQSNKGTNLYELNYNNKYGGTINSYNGFALDQQPFEVTFFSKNQDEAMKEKEARVLLNANRLAEIDQEIDEMAMMTYLDQVIDLECYNDSLFDLAWKMADDYANAVKIQVRSDMLKGSAKQTFLNNYLQLIGINRKDKNVIRQVFNMGYGLTKTGYSTYATASSQPPSTHIPMKNTAFSITGKFGTERKGNTKNHAGFFMYKSQAVKEPIRGLSAYGYLYSQNKRSDNKDIVMDYSVENNSVVNKNSKFLPRSVAAPDLYFIQGQQMNGTFRAFRSDIGIYHNESIRSESGDYGFGGEYAIGGTGDLKFGGNSDISSIEQYNGPWQMTANNGFYEQMGFTSPTDSIADEHTYFKFVGESTSMEDTRYKFFKNYRASRVDINKNSSGSAKINCTTDKVQTNHNESTGSTGLLSEGINTHRTPRNTLVEYYTKSELQKKGSDVSKLSPHCKNHHIAEYNVTNSNGMKFKYQAAAYNLLQKEVMFAVDGSSSSLSEPTIQYSNIYPPIDGLGQISCVYPHSRDRLYTATETGPFAHSYLLTEITSQDYVDKTYNGPSDDDQGYWVKFTYTQPKTMKWRAPFTGANLLRGHLSDDKDDKASYTYGEKEVRYVSRIETKTHYVEFYLKERVDAKEPASEHNLLSNGSITGTRSMMRLDSLSLFSKKSSIPIKTAHLEYSTKLCPETQNSKASNKGKLTLDKVYFTYGKSRKGESSPYKFTYNTNGFDYNLSNTDSWGYYSSTNTIAENRFVKQSEGVALDSYAKAWNLSKIELPSGGEILIEYEMDDYAYVQRRRAQRFFEILGFGGLASKNQDYTKLKNKDEHCKLYFDPDGFDVSKMQDIRHFLPSSKHKPFVKVFMKLKNKTSFASSVLEVKDYVDGYVGLESVGYDQSLGYPYLKMILPEGQDNMKINPVRFLGFSHLFSARPDLNDGFVEFDDMSILSLCNSVVSNLKKKADKFISPFKTYKMSGYCKEVVFPDDSGQIPPSYIRLNEPDYIKKGGGHRVKSITMKDNWGVDATQAYTYKTTYTYRTTKETSRGIHRTISSGVAENEPYAAKGENPLYQPTYYGVESTINKHYKHFTDEPIGVASYPGPNVKYSKVIVQTDIPEDALASNPGTTVHEFFTAYDFPIRSYKTDIETVVKEPNRPILNSLVQHVPFAKYKDRKKYGFSQGFKVVFNDMHGKAKSVSSYPAGLNVLDPANDSKRSSFTKYEYYLSDDGQHLENEVDCLIGDCDVKKMAVGVQYDASVYTDEAYYKMENRKDIANLDILVNPPAPPVPVPMYYNYRKMQEREYKIVSFNEIIRKQGVLKRVVEQKDGLTHVTENLMFDAYTGNALLTASRNNYDKPVYSYNFPAHWNYDDIALNFNNTRKHIETKLNTRDIEVIRAYFHVGDIVQINDGDIYYVNSINPGATNVIDFRKYNSTTGIPATQNANIDQSVLKKYTILKSGRTNLNSASSGSLVSLQNPVTQRRFPLFDTIANLNGNATNPNLPTPSYTTSSIYKMRDCKGIVHNVRICYHDHMDDDVLTFTLNPTSLAEPCEYNADQGQCWAELRVDGKMNLTNVNKIDSIRKKGNNAYIYYTGNSTKAMKEAEWIDITGCFIECMDDVLNAQALEFKPVRDGQQNFWRQYLANSYRVDRKQKGKKGRKTNIRKDGVYDYFEVFSWQKGNDNNDQSNWRWQSKITKYNDAGFEVESMDAMDIYSTAEYGYDNSLVSAVVNNAKKCEVLFEGFEDVDYTSYPIVWGTSGNSFSLNFSNNDGLFAHNSLEAHTGDKSIMFDEGDATFTFNVLPEMNAGWLNEKDKALIVNKNYVLSAWVHMVGRDINLLSVTSNTTVDYEIDESPIDGWHKVDIHFRTPSTQTPVTISITGGISHLDDIRLHPYNAQMISYVYNPLNYRLKAQLDENNFASIYNYDEEGILIQSKKETVEGVKTISTNRQNVKNKDHE